MSGMKEVVYMIQMEHNMFHSDHFEPLCKLCAEQKAMAVYDHTRADEVDSTEEEYAE